MPDTFKKTLLKSITWRVLGTLITALSIYFASGSFQASLLIGGADAVIKLIAYFVHERVWNKIRI